MTKLTLETIKLIRPVSPVMHKSVVGKHWRMAMTVRVFLKYQKVKGHRTFWVSQKNGDGLANRLPTIVF